MCLRQRAGRTSLCVSSTGACYWFRLGVPAHNLKAQKRHGVRISDARLPSWSYIIREKRSAISSCALVQVRVFRISTQWMIGEVE